MEEAVIRVRTAVLRELLRWREVLPAVVNAVKRVLGDVEIYVFGSAIEGKLTADSDIDIAIVLDEVPRRGLDRASIIDAIWSELEKKGIPWWYPLELHLLTKREKEMLEKGGAKFIDVNELLAPSR